MKTTYFTSLLGSIAIFGGSASAFKGWITAHTAVKPAGPPCAATPYIGDFSYVAIYDSYSTSTYACATTKPPSECKKSCKCNVECCETSPGGYTFKATYWQSDDGCHNFDFKGALDAKAGYCKYPTYRGAAPSCQFTA
ncbi:hypothetical protein B0T24DRAFT_680090 [Lasiosphaeria ovina]|uniref:Secreted protein n=1 Tax=Lasiosphaeria ovina TaxID=92902 RepID=A0AAE0N681_9PEZI|nr:hypothetical protein B0T24DRAFT_680090 [Lasiosphaeria ovina]